MGVEAKVIETLGVLGPSLDLYISKLFVAVSYHSSAFQNILLNPGKVI